MLGVRRDLCESSGPTPLPKQGHLEQVPQDLVQAGFEYLQRRRIHKLSGQPVPVLRHPFSALSPFLHPSPFYSSDFLSHLSAEELGFANTCS